MQSKSLLRIARSVHAWMGAFLALLLIVVSLTGMLLIWKDAYVGFVFPQSAQGFERSVDATAHVALSAEKAFGAENIYRIEFGDENFGINKVDLVGNRAAYLAADGRVLDVWELNGRPEEWLLDLHHRLLARTAGLYVVGFSGIATVVMIIAGMVAYWPRRASWRKGFALRSFRRPQLLLSHRNIGIWLAVPVALIILSGVVLTFPETSRNAFFSTDDETYGERFGDGVDMVSGHSEATWPRAIARAATVFPDGEITGLVWPTGGDEILINVRNEGEWSDHGNSVVQITAYDGFMDLRIDARTLPFGEKAHNAMTPLHRSGTGGFIYDSLLTLIGLAMIYVGAIGFLSFIGSRLFFQRQAGRS